MNLAFIYIEKFLLRTQIWVACMFVLLLAFFQKIHSEEPNQLILAFFMVQSAYLFVIHRNSIRTFHWKNTYVLIFFGSLLGLIMCLLYDDVSFFKLSCIAALTFLYNSDFKQKSLRKLAYVKGFIVGLVWSISISWLFLSEFHVELFGSLFLFITSLTWIFDLKSDGIHDDFPTLYSILGLKKLQSLCIILFLCSACLFCISEVDTVYKIAWLITQFLAIGFTVFASNQRNDAYFSLYMESIIGVPFFVLFITNN